MADEGGFTPAPEYNEFGTAEGTVAEQKTSGKAIAALVCGIGSLILFGVILGIIAIVLGVIARKEIAGNPQLKGSGMALAGIITGVIGAILAVVLIAAGVTLV